MVAQRKTERKWLVNRYFSAGWDLADLGVGREWVAGTSRECTLVKVLPGRRERELVFLRRNQVGEV